MITDEQARELRRLASLWATARVRKAMVHSGFGGPGETSLGVTERADKAAKEFESYLNSLKDTQ